MNLEPVFKRGRNGYQDFKKSVGHNIHAIAWRYFKDSLLIRLDDLLIALKHPIQRRNRKI